MRKGEKKKDCSLLSLNRQNGIIQNILCLLFCLAIFVWKSILILGIHPMKHPNHLDLLMFHLLKSTGEK